MGSQSGTNKVGSRVVVEAKTKQVNSELEKSLSYTQCKLTSPFEIVSWHSIVCYLFANFENMVLPLSKN